MAIVLQQTNPAPADAKSYGFEDVLKMIKDKIDTQNHNLPWNINATIFSELKSLFDNAPSNFVDTISDLVVMIKASL